MPLNPSEPCQSTRPLRGSNRVPAAQSRGRETVFRDRPSLLDAEFARGMAQSGATTPNATSGRHLARFGPLPVTPNDTQRHLTTLPGRFLARFARVRGLPWRAVHGGGIPIRKAAGSKWASDRLLLDAEIALFGTPAAPRDGWAKTRRRTAGKDVSNRSTMQTNASVPACGARGGRSGLQRGHRWPESYVA